MNRWDVVICGGIAIVAIGAGLIYLPAGVMLAGAGVIVTGLVGSAGGKEKRTP